MKATKKAIEIEYITFEDFVKYGVDHGANIVKGMPWSFDYQGHPITHENDKCYLIPTEEGSMKFTPKDVLITGVDGEIYPCKKSIFEKTYDLAQTDEAKSVYPKYLIGEIVLAKIDEEHYRMGTISDAEFKKEEGWEYAFRENDGTLTTFQEISILKKLK
jgi:hypothetical protein